MCQNVLSARMGGGSSGLARHLWQFARSAVAEPGAHLRPRVSLVVIVVANLPARLLTLSFLCRLDPLLGHYLCNRRSWRREMHYTSWGKRPNAVAKEHIAGITEFGQSSGQHPRGQGTIGWMYVIAQDSSEPSIVKKISLLHLCVSHKSYMLFDLLLERCIIAEHTALEHQQCAELPKTHPLSQGYHAQWVRGIQKFQNLPAAAQAGYYERAPRIPFGGAFESAAPSRYPNDDSQVRRGGAEAGARVWVLRLFGP